MVGRSISFHVHIVAALLGIYLCLCAQSTAWAAVYPNEINFVPIAYQPKLMTSEKDVVKTLSDYHEFFAFWCSQMPGSTGREPVSCMTNFYGGTITRINLSHSHIEMLGTGSPSPFVFFSLDFANIKSAEIYQTSKLADEPFPIVVKIVPQQRNVPLKTYWLRALNLDTAKALTNVFSTLAAAGSGNIKLKADSKPLQFGISARNLNMDEKKQAGIDSGIYIGAVDAGSPAAKIGIASGDLLLQINGAKVADLDAAKKLLSAAPVTSVKVLRKGKILTLNALTKM